MLAQPASPAGEPHEPILLAAVDVAFFTCRTCAVVDNRLDSDAGPGFEICDVFAHLFNDAGELVAERYGDFFFCDGMRSCRYDRGAAEILVEVWVRMLEGVVRYVRNWDKRVMKFGLPEPQMPTKEGLSFTCPLPHVGIGTCSILMSSLPWKRTAFIVILADEWLSFLDGLQRRVLYSLYVSRTVIWS